MSLAAVAAGADGLLIEVHHDPSQALCDADQALTPLHFETLMRQLRPLCGFMQTLADETKKNAATA
jgi:3-deoxy-D-arabino-heptulosonate 7-phosphate (DAHP) synthase